MIRIYTLADPRDLNHCRYVGQTSSSLKSRLAKHLQVARAGGETNNSIWIRELLSLGLTPVIVEVDQVTEDQLAVAEKYWIAKYRTAGHQLLNMTTGGQTRARKYETEADAHAAYRQQNNEAAERWRRKQGMRSNAERRMTPEERRRARNESAKRWRKRKNERT